MSVDRGLWVVRAGSSDIADLRRNAAATWAKSQHTMLGVSARCGRDELAALGGVFRSSVKSVAPVADILDAGFPVRWTFRNPHVTIDVPDTSDDTLGTLASLFTLLGGTSTD